MPDSLSWPEVVLAVRNFASQMSGSINVDIYCADVGVYICRYISKFLSLTRMLVRFELLCATSVFSLTQRLEGGQRVSRVIAVRSMYELMRENTVNWDEAQGEPGEGSKKR
jgi:hypothetical protein